MKLVSVLSTLVCLVPLIISSLERERHVTTRQRVPIRKLQSISKSDVD